MVHINHDQQQPSRAKLIVSAAAASNSIWSVYETKILVFVGLVCEMNGFYGFLREQNSKRAKFSLRRKVFETNKK